MTTFIDGPAAGQKLSLRRAPVFLRVTELLGKFDGLDQLDDEPEPGETLYCYVLAEKPRTMHLYIRGKEAKTRGGFWPIAEYKLVPEQPSQEIMLYKREWVIWTNSQALPEYLR